MKKCKCLGEENAQEAVYSTKAISKENHTKKRYCRYSEKESQIQQGIQKFVSVVGNYSADDGYRYSANGPCKP